MQPGNGSPARSQQRERLGESNNCSYARGPQRGSCVRMRTHVYPTGDLSLSRGAGRMHATPRRSFPSERCIPPSTRSRPSQKWETASPFEGLLGYCPEVMNRRAGLLAICCTALTAAAACMGGCGSSSGDVLVALVTGHGITSRMVTHWMTVDAAADGTATSGTQALRRWALGLLI